MGPEVLVKNKGKLTEAQLKISNIWSSGNAASTRLC